MSVDDSVKVAVRIRPLVTSEKSKGCQSVVSKINGEPQVCVNSNDNYTFNYVFDVDDTQQYIYEQSVSNMLGKLFKGYNVTILAYGQTGSGKTHTMGTAFSGTVDENMGVIPRAIKDIFKNIEEETENEINVTCSFMELYQEQLYDLLSPSSRDQSTVDIREDKGGIVIPGLTEITVHNAMETTNCLMKGSAGRAVGATAMNQQSSRSHAVFTVNIRKTEKSNSNLSTTAKFHLVDLAGSERSKKTKATGDRFKEGVKINQGLLALGNVISALGHTGGTGFVSYRDSKLTRLLQDSLGGNSLTLMIACISPADYNTEETISTLRYADRAKKIRNKPIINQDPQAAEISRLNGIIQKLRMELLSVGGGYSSIAPTNSSAVCYPDTSNGKNAELIKKNRMIQQQLQSTLHDLAENEMQVLYAQAANEELMQVIKIISNEICENESFTHERYRQAIKNIEQYIADVNVTLEKNKEDSNQNKCISPSLHNSVTEIESHSEDEQRKVDAFTTKQMDFNNELRRINRELLLKQELQEKVSINLTKFCSFENSNEDEKLRESESYIQVLEAEKAELVDKLKHVKENASAKLSEERRKRLQNLEQEISKLKQQNLQQSKILKVREKDSQKIHNLNKEIQNMKSVKVKLIRAMKAESDNFRQWKLSREKQLTQLKEKDRKRQNEIIRMESIHNKQRNVLKRKVEEAMAVNKRLKTALEKQKSAQQHRNTNKSVNKVDQVITWVDHELDVIMSVIDADFSLKQLMEDRGVMTQRLQELQNPENIDNDTNNSDEIATLQRDLEMRNAQINDLLAIVTATDLESKMKSICESIQSMPEARAALKHLFHVLTEMRKEFAPKDSKLHEIKNACELADEKIENLQAELKKANVEHQENLSTIEKNYEEKISILLREINSAPKLENGVSAEWAKEHQETIAKLDIVRQKLDIYKAKLAALQKNHSNRRLPPKPNKFEESWKSDSFESSEDEYFSDYSKDPDWKKTPLIKRKIHRNKKMLQQSTSMDSISFEEGSTLKCACKSGCGTKRCRCRQNNRTCSTHCKCTKSCMNKELQGSDDDSCDEEKENMSSNSTNLKMAVLTEINDTHTPIKPQISDVSKLNATGILSTPQYPYSMKNKRPFFNK